MTHPNGYQGPGLNLRDSRLREGYDPTQLWPEMCFGAINNSEGYAAPSPGSTSWPLPPFSGPAPIDPSPSPWLPPPASSPLNQPAQELPPPYPLPYKQMPSVPDPAAGPSLGPSPAAPNRADPAALEPVYRAPQGTTITPVARPNQSGQRGPVPSQPRPVAPPAPAPRP